VTGPDDRPGDGRAPDPTWVDEFRSEQLPREGLGAQSGGYKRIIANPSFRRLWIGQVISGIGDWLVIGLLIPLVTQLSNGSALAVAGIMIAKIIPSLVYGSVLGSLVDRFDRRQLMITCDLTQMVLALGLLFTNSLALIYLIVLMLETMGLMFYPAKNALIPQLVEERDLAVANGLSYTTQQASMLIGLTMSGAIVALFEQIVRFVIQAHLPIVGLLVGPAEPYLLGPRSGVLLDSLTFLVSAFMIYGIAVGPSGRREEPLSLRLIGKDVIDSFRFLGAHHELRAFLISIGLAILGGGAIISVGLVYVTQNLTGGVPFLDKVPALQRLTSTPQVFMLVFLALGMVLGALIVPRLARGIHLNVLLVVGIGGFGTAMLGFSLVGMYWAAALFAICAGFFLAEVTVAGNTYVSETVADSIRGRVFTAMESVIRVSLLLSLVVTAPVGDLVGSIVRRVVLSSGAVPAHVVWTGSRITLVFASLIVMGAAVFALRRIEWRRNEEAGADAV
jgi:MFS family permease